MTSNEKQNPKQTSNFDEIWQILKETAKRQEEFNKSFDERLIKYAKHNEESNEKFDKEMEKRRAEFDEKLEKSRIKFDEEIRKSRIEFDKKMNKMRGIWSNAWGDFVESLVSGSLVKMLQEWIPSINMIMKNIECHRNGRDCEIDIIAVNSDSLVATEVKSTLSVKDVNDFLEKLRNFTLFFPQFKNYKIYGAVAYLKVTQGAEKFAMNQGLFVIRATGDSGEILNKKDTFKPQAIKQVHIVK